MSEPLFEIERQPMPALLDHLAQRKWDVIHTFIDTRNGPLDCVARRGKTIAFISLVPNGDTVSAKEKARIRRAAVSWMATHAREQQGVRKYRFDLYLADGTMIENAF